MSKITPEDIEKVALLSRLAFTPEEAAAYAEQLTKILDYADKINELDTKDVEPTSHSLAMVNVFRTDERHQCLTNEQALANAPESEDGCFKVPPIIQESS